MKWIFFIWLLVWYSVVRAQCVANAGPDQNISKHAYQTVLDGSGSAGTNLTYTWKLLTSVSSDWMSQMKGRGNALCDVYVLPWREYYEYELTVTGDGPCTDKDTVRVYIDYGTVPPQSPDGFQGWHYATSTDVSVINATNAGLCRVGDIIIAGANTQTGPGGNNVSVNINMTTGMTLLPGARVLIKAGSYGEINLDFVANECVGTAENPIIITNYGGQVECNALLLQHAVHTKITGKYVLGESGHPSYQGHAGGNYAFSRGKYGIFCNNMWSSLASWGVRVYGEFTDNVECEFVEVGNGFFAGMMWKNDNTTNNWEGCNIHDCYIHDIHGEGVYIGSTGADPEHQLLNFQFSNTRIVNAGNEIFQLNQVGYGTRVYNNVFINSATNRKSTFGNFQSNGIQVGSRYGYVRISNCIVLGGGDCFTNFFAGNITGVSDPNDTVYLCNNLFKYSVGFLGAYFNSYSDAQSFLRVKIDSNYWGGQEFQGNLMYTDQRGTNSQFFLRLDLTPPTWLVRGNVTDNSKTTFINAVGGATVVSNDNNIGEVPNPSFVNCGWPADWNNNNIAEWCDTIYRVWGDEPSSASGVNVGGTITYQLNNWVIWLGKYYKSKINGNHGHVPRGYTDDYWELQTWSDDTDTYTYPPDDYRLTPGSFYQVKGMGLLDVGPDNTKRNRSKFKRFGKVSTRRPD